MLRRLILARVASAEKEWGVSLNYCRFILRVSLRAFFKFAKFLAVDECRAGVDILSGPGGQSAARVGPTNMRATRSRQRAEDRYADALSNGIPVRFHQASVGQTAQPRYQASGGGDGEPV